MDGMTLISEARAAGLSIRAEGDTLVVKGPQHAETVARNLLTSKPTVLAALRAMWNPEVADSMIDATLARISKLHDEIAPGCSVDQPGWDEVEALVSAAYALQSLVSLQEALASYEQHGTRCFVEWQARVRRTPRASTPIQEGDQ